MVRFTLLSFCIFFQCHCLDASVGNGGSVVAQSISQSVVSAPQQAAANIPASSPQAAATTVESLHRQVLGMPAAQVVQILTQQTPGMAVQTMTQPAPQQTPAGVQSHIISAPALTSSPTKNVQVPTAAANSATNAANAAADAANAAVVAANTAANAAATANRAANAAVTDAKSAADSAQAEDAAETAVAAANTAANAAASANMAANMAANANTAAANAASVAVSATSATATLGNSAQGSLPTGIRLDGPNDAWSTSQWYWYQFSGAFAGLTFAMFIKALCIAGNVLVHVSPFPTARKWDARGCTGEADAAPYVSIAFGGCQWCFYGLFAWLVTSRSGFLILVHSNCLGAILGSYYVSTFYRNCRNEDALRTLQKYVSAVTALAALQVCALSVLPAERALFLIGIISSFCSFINATSVLVTVPQVLRTKDSRSIPGHYACANLLSSMVWTLCGYILSDPCVMMPNFFSTGCAGASLVLKVIYPASDDDKLLAVEEGRKEVSIFKAAKKEFKITKEKKIKIPKEATPMLKEPVSKSIGGTFQEESVVATEKIEEPRDRSFSVASAGDGTGGTF
jgi:hypothetical protein